MALPLQFEQSMHSEQQRAAAVLRRHGTPVQADASQPLMEQFSYDPKNPQSRGSSYDQYLYGRSLIRGADEKPDFQQTMTGRIATRLVTRGVFGALAFTWAGNYANRSLKNYDPASIRNFSEWRTALFNPHSTPVLAEGAHEVEKYINRPNTMQAIAKMFDTAFGEPIKMGARMLAPKGREEFWANKAVQFRPRAMHHDPISKIRPDADWAARHYGRSLGHEVVAITTDFAAASAADAFTRNIAQAIDPNVEKDWYKDGHFSLSKFGKDWARRTWQVVSFNQGEDWAVAVPYAYFMKWHRNVIDKLSPGFKYASDHSSWNGASDKVLAHVDAGKITKLTKVGDFQAEGAWDLQARFTVYNVLTLMYREAYKSVGNTLGNWWKGDQWLPKLSLSSNPVEAVVEGAGNAVRYTAKSFIKANLYMQPAVPFFWAFRVAQNKWRGSPIIVNDKNNPNELLPPDSSIVPTVKENVPQSVHQNLRAEFSHQPDLVEGYYTKANARKNIDSAYQVGFDRNGKHRYSYLAYPDHAGPLYVGKHEVTNHPYYKHNPYEGKNAGSLFASVTGPLGSLSHSAGRVIGDKILGGGIPRKARG